MDQADRQILSDFIKEAGFPEEWADEILAPELKVGNWYRVIDREANKNGDKVLLYTYTAQHNEHNEITRVKVLLYSGRT